MSPELHRDILQRLSEFGFQKPRNGWLHGGKCPSCGKKELYTNEQNPWVLRCNRLNNCGFEVHIKDYYPDLFESWSTRYQPNESNHYNPNAAADAYLAQARGFDIDKIKGWYRQESYYDAHKNIGSATVRFDACGSWWERLIDKPERFEGSKARFAPGSHYKGFWWAPPGVDLINAEEIYIVEGIFNAIALFHHGITAVSIMSCHNYPGQELNALKEAVEGVGLTRPRLVWALDNDKAGKKAAVKHKQRAEEDGWLCTMAIIPYENKDWNDLHLLDWGRFSDEKQYLSKEALKNYQYEGRIFTAKSAADKAILLYQRDDSRKAFDFSYKNNWFWYEIDWEKYEREIQDVADNNPELDHEKIREKALWQSHALRKIGNFFPELLYFQQNKVTDESWYYCRITLAKDGSTIKNTFTTPQLNSLKDFKNRAMAIARGAVFTGSSKMLEHFVVREMEHVNQVDAVDFIGYVKEYDAYIFNEFAVKAGKIYKINQDDYFNINRLSIKTLNKSVQLDINNTPKDYKNTWLQHLWTTYGPKGIVALTFWFGSLFAEQIREQHRSYPFLEIVGDAGTGKTAIIEFLWKLFGRDYEGFDPSKSSLAARARNFSQVSGLPVVLIESDRESSQGNTVKGFDWDELKTAYNGRSLRARGVATAGNETYEPPFRGSIVIAQNNPVSSSEAIMQRICQLYFRREDTTEQSSKSIKELQGYAIENVSGFILSAVTKQEDVMKIMASHTETYQKQLLSNPKISIPRIALNHAQLLSLLDALCLVVKLSEHQQEQTKAYITDMAVKRQEAVSDDHPIVSEFWEVYEYLNGDEFPVLNHSRDPKTIAINLNEFVQLATEHKQQLAPLRELKTHLKNSRRHQFIGQECIYSTIRARQPDKRSTSIRAWIFKK